MKKETVYYQNIQCELIAELGNNESVIELDTQMYVINDTHEEQGYCEPISRKIIVNNSDLSKEKITKDLFLKDLESTEAKIIAKANDKANSIISEAFKENSRLLQSNKDLREKSKKFDGLHEMYKYLNGDYKYVVSLKNGYNEFGIKKLDESFDENDRQKEQLKAVVFRKLRYYDKKEVQEVKMYISRYYYDSNDSIESKGFETLEEAKTYLINYILEPSTTINIYIASECKKWEINIDKVNKFNQEKELEIADKKAKEIKDLEDKLFAIKGN